MIHTCNALTGDFPCCYEWSGGEEGYERRNEQIERVETRDSKSGKRPLGWDDLELFHLRPGNTATGVDKQQYP